MHRSSWLFPLALTLVIPVGLLQGPAPTAAYGTYSAPANAPCTEPACNWSPGNGTACQQCHANPFNANTIHNQHRNELITSNPRCELCHSNDITGDRAGVFTNRSMGVAGDNNSTWGCAGCHGNNYGELRNNPYLPAAENGVPKMSSHGLRLHHENTIGVGICNMAGCHAAVTPLPESNAPPYFARTNVDVRDPCNPLRAGAGAEDFRSLPNRVAAMGLDNDGDLLYDTTPPAPYLPDNDCLVTAGACCSNGSCTMGTSAACAAAGGTYQGDNAPCGVNGCGACCLAAGGCADRVATGCGTPDVFWTGVTCAADPSPCIASCVRANLLSIGNSVRLVRTGVSAGDISYSWTGPGDGASEFHANYVSTKAEIPTPRRAPVGPALSACAAAGTVFGCTEAGGVGRADPVAFYQVLSACGSSGLDEGP